LQGIHGLHITSFGLACNDCHASVVDAGLNITNRSLHVNGSVDTLTANPATCANCHAAAPTGCVYCHGGVDNQTGAPPKGLRGETATTTIPVGAHTKHMNGSALAGPLKCSDCHTSYTYVTDAGHFAADSVAEIVWGNFANRNGGAVWNRSTKTCANTYCHGNFAGGIAANAPVWTSASQAACGSCHDVGIHPSLLLGEHSAHAGEGVACYRCHFGTLNSSDQISNPGAHADGEVTVQFWTGTGSWDATQNSCSPPSGQGCHGQRSWY
jgi:predicted CxxxxCH...CXXCH cytochrome family protein